MTELTIPSMALVVLIGASGSGKSTFARTHFKPTEVLSSDVSRGLVADDENDQSATRDAFEILHFIAAKRLAAGRLTVVDATNVQASARKPLIELARTYHMLPVAIVFDLPERLSHERNRSRPDRNFGPHVVRRQLQDLRRSLRGLDKEGFRTVHVFHSVADVDAVERIAREPLYSHKHHEHGPFDLIGDVHGCFDELVLLLERLGYAVHLDPRVPAAIEVTPPPGRKAVFLGDLVDRGPRVPDVLRLVMHMVDSGTALCVPGNHESKLLRALQGRNVQRTHGLPESLAQLQAEPVEFVDRVKSFIDGLTSHYVLDRGQLVVAHAGLKQEMHGRGSRRVRDFALYGETTGETDEYGLPVRYPWAVDYRGPAMVVYGHTPVPYPPQWLNNTLCIDTGCVFGGALTALRYPEKELVSIPAAREYYAPARPLSAAPPVSAAEDDLLDLEDVSGRRVVPTRLGGTVLIAEENSAAALEAMSRWAVDPRWLVYLPPTMSPSETSALEGLLEHPREAFAYFAAEGVAHVVCEEKHMGSRAVVVLCRTAHAAAQRFGVPEAESAAGGIVYTRTGRRFFGDTALEAALLDRLRTQVTDSGLWDELASDWLLLDCELMPWSAKAQELLRQQYAAVGAAAGAALDAGRAVLESAAQRGLDVADLLESTRQRAALVARYVDAYRHYCWPVSSLEDLRIAPFHLLASEGAVHIERDHVWHMDTLARLAADPLVLATPYQVVALGASTGDPGARTPRSASEPAAPGARTPLSASEPAAPGMRTPRSASEPAAPGVPPISPEQAIAWWQTLTSRGGEGMVVKPLSFVARNARGHLVQPALKCRGPEYLRLIYGAEYSLPEHLSRLRQRGVGRKRALAGREFALGIEALSRFVAREPLRRVHECVFGVLALESEPVDPRL